MANDLRRSPDEHFQRMRKEITDLVQGDLIGIVTDVEDMPPERLKCCSVGYFVRYDQASGTVYLATPTWRECNNCFEGTISDLKEQPPIALTAIREIRKYELASTTLIDGYFDDRRES